MAANYFSNKEKEIIVNAIKKAEFNTSGEIRVHIESFCVGDPYMRALKVFGKLKMHRTAQRNAVLFYLTTRDRKFAVVGDEGIHQKVKSDFWQTITTSCLSFFKKGEIAVGLAHGIECAGLQLKAYFPYNVDDVNELNDEISFGK